MHERVQRRVCRALFLGGCLLPTLLTLAWAGWCHLPGRVARHRHLLSEQFGLQVSLGDAHSPRPGVMRYSGVELAEPETGRTLVHIDSLQVSPLSDKLLMVASSVQIEPDGLQELWQCLGRRLRSAAASTLSISASEVSWTAGEQLHRFHVAQLKVEPSQAGVEANLTFALAGPSQPCTARLRIVRNRQTIPPLTAWEFESGREPVPCSLLTPLQPDVARLGPRSSFRGALWATETPAGCDGELTGELNEVELSGLSHGLRPHQLTGTARVNVTLARFRAGRLEELTATLSAGPGRMSRSFVGALVERMGLDAVIPGESLEEVVPYQQVAAQVWLNSRGLVLEGASTSGGAGAVVVAPWGTLRTPSSSIARPVTALVQLLAPPGEALVPLSRETQYLSRVLPLPAEKGE